MINNTEDIPLPLPLVIMKSSNHFVVNLVSMLLLPASVVNGFLIDLSRAFPTLGPLRVR